jgi:hypothetical protein
LRYHRTCGLDEEQLTELVSCVEDLLDQPWDRGTGRPKGLPLYDAVVVCLMYERHNITEEVLADFFGTSQPVISRVITQITPLIDAATEEFRPSPEEAEQVIKGAVALVDGTLWPCWSWAANSELWAGKYGTTGHGSLIISDLEGNVVFISDPASGKDHDMRKLQGDVKTILEKAGGVIGDKGFQGSGYVTPVKKPKNGELLLREVEFNNQLNSLRAPVERAVANIKAWRILHTDYRRPIKTFLASFRAAIGLYFFQLSFG